MNLIFWPKFEKLAHCPNKNLRCYLFYTFSQNVVAHTIDPNNKVTKYFYQNHNNIDWLFIKRIYNCIFLHQYCIHQRAHIISSWYKHLFLLRKQGTEYFTKCVICHWIGFYFMSIISIKSFWGCETRILVLFLGCTRSGR